MEIPDHLWWRRISDEKSEARAEITREKFIEATGREPEHDDLERCNCQLAGRFGHDCCGWNEEQNKPQFEVGPISLKTSKGS